VHRLLGKIAFMEGEFAKTMLRVGTYHSPDGVVEVTPERLRHWERQVKAIQSVGYAIPSHFDHSDDVELLTPIAETELRAKRSRSAQFTVGKLKSFNVTPDGQAAEIVLHTLDPKATQSVAANAVYVSPVVHPAWKDGAGNRYPDALTSFDLVDWPVDHSQSSFTPLIRMGQRVCPAIRMGASKPYILERPGMTTKAAKNRSTQARKARFKAALNAGLKRMGSDYKPEDDEDEIDAVESAAPDTVDSGADTPTPSDDASPTDTIGADAVQAPDLLDSVLNLLGEYGVTLPDDTTDDSLINHLRVALTALLSQQGDSDDDEGMDDDMGAQPNAMPQPVTPTIATMSVQQRKALERAEIAERALAENRKSNVTQRLATLLKTGRCTPAEHDAQLRTLGTVRMSMRDDGTFKSSRVDYFLEDRESVPQGTYWTSEQRTKSIEKLSVVEPPDAITSGGGRSHSEYAEAVRALGGNPDE
jgi:hypothetical protein